jgi:hypothetical protein
MTDQNTNWVWDVGGPFNAVAEEGVSFKEIAEVIGRRLDIPVVSNPPEEALEHFGWFAAFAGLDVPTSSERTDRYSAGRRNSRVSSSTSITRIFCGVEGPNFR